MRTGHRPLRIVDVTDFYSERGGVRAHLDLKGQVLCQLGHAHTVVASGPQNSDDLRTAPRAGESLQGGGSRRVIRIKGPALPYDANYHLMWRTRRVYESVIGLEPHVVEINSPYLAAWAMRNLHSNWGSIKTFWWHADFIDTYVRHFMGRGRSGAAIRNRTATLGDLSAGLLWCVVRTMLRSCAAVFSASNEQAQKLRSYGVERVIVLPFGTDKRVFRPAAFDPAYRAQVLHRAGLPPTASVLVAVGRFAIEKQWDLLINAFLSLRKRHAAVLVAYGDGPERARIANRMSSRADILFMGFERDKSRLASALASADAFIHACPYETYGLSVAQAIACGLPLVVADQGGASEQVDASFAERFAAGDPDACAAAIARLLVRDSASTRTHARRAAEHLPDVRDQIGRTVEIYRELLQAERTRGAHARSRFFA